MIRVLQIIGSLERAGAETFLINLYRNIDRTKIQFDFAIYNEPSENSYYQEVIEMGGEVFILPPKLKGILNNFRAIQKIVQVNQYKVVWKHTDNCFNALDLLVAKSAGSTYTIMHSHSSNVRRIEWGLHFMVRPFVNLFVTKRFACGDMAGHWMFGRRSFEVINNGIDAECFRYSQEIRNQYRQNFQLQGKAIVGHVGRFHTVKNHRLIIDVFEKFREKTSEAALILIGTGELLSQIQELVREKGLEKDVLFLGTRSDIPELLQMMDVFVMPSLYEGFPVTLIEAQAAGLPCVVSSAISEEVDFIGNVSFVDLDAPAEVWAERIAEKCGSKTEDNTEKLKAAGYDIKDVAKKIEAYMLEMVES